MPESSASLFASPSTASVVPALAVCLCFKDSARYLDEWLRFHYVQGARRFYLYDNESTDDYLRVIEPWQRAGLVELTRFSGRGVQRQMYDDCLDKARGRVRWLAFLDDDEFLYSPSGDLLETLERYRAHAGVAASWMLFGSGGVETDDGAWVLRRFTRTTARADQHVKCIVQPERIAHSILIGHQFQPVDGQVVVHEDYRPQVAPLDTAPVANRLRINHYLVKSWEEWRHRRQRPQADTGQVTPHAESNWRGWDEDWSSGCDVFVQRYIPEMQALDLAKLRM